MLRFEELAIDCNDRLVIYDGAHAIGNHKVSSETLVGASKFLLSKREKSPERNKQFFPRFPPLPPPWCLSPNFGPKPNEQKWALGHLSRLLFYGRGGGSGRVSLKPNNKKLLVQSVSSPPPPVSFFLSPFSCFFRGRGKKGEETNLPR
jgi:hypothetical protein